MRTRGWPVLLGALLVVPPLAGCEADGAQGQTASPRPVTVTDAHGDTERHGVRSRKTANVDLDSLTATYDYSGLVLEVTYADPVGERWPDDGFGIEIHIGRSPDEGGDWRMLWDSSSPESVDAFDSEDMNPFCHPEVTPDFAAGRVTFTYPDTFACLGSRQRRPERIAVVQVHSDAEGDVTDEFPTTGDPENVAWVTRG